MRNILKQYDDVSLLLIIMTFIQGDYKHWIQECGQGTQGPKDLGPEDLEPKEEPEYLRALQLLQYNYTDNPCQCYSQLRLVCC